MTVEGKLVFLRNVLPGDLETLLTWENDPTVWEVSGTSRPFSRDTMEQFVLSPPNLYEHLQQRFIICLCGSGEPLGCVDLFDYNHQNHRAGLGILIYDPTHRRKGYATEAIELLMSFSKENIRIHQLYCNVLENNPASLKMFLKLKFETVGTKLDWHAGADGWKNEILLQRIL